MMIGIGMPRAQSTMPRISNLASCQVRYVGGLHGELEARRITTGWLLQPHAHTREYRRTGRLEAVHRFEARVEQVAGDGEELKTRGDIVGDGEVGNHATRR